MEIKIDTKEESADSLRRLAQYLSSLADARQGRKRNRDIFGGSHEGSEESNASQPSSGMFSMFDSQGSKTDDSSPNPQVYPQDEKEQAEKGDEEITFDINDFIY
jgi:hypothetical protein